MSHERWIALLVGVITVIITLIILAVLERGYSQAQGCVDAETRERIRALTIEGYDEALKAHTVRLFAVWLQDYQPEPKRAAVGTQNGISAYVRARAGALKWEPPTC